MSSRETTEGPPIFKGPNATELIQRIGQEDLLTGGRLHVLCLEAIRDRNARRWPLRQEGVWDYITREFEKSAAETDQLVRLDDVNFLLIQPTQTAIGAQSKALRILRICLKFFLGEALNADIKLNLVTEVTDYGMQCEPIAVNGLMVARLEAEAELENSSSPEDSESEVEDCPALEERVDPHFEKPFNTPAWTAYQNASFTRPVPRMLRGDREYEVLFTAEPIWTIKQRAIACYSLRPLIFTRCSGSYVTTKISEISTRDLIRLDLIVLAEAQRLRRSEGDSEAFALSVPINQQTLTSTPGRQAVQAALDAMQPWAAATLIISIHGLEEGAPNIKITELVAGLRSRCRAVVARAPNLTADIGHWRGARLSGLAVDLHPLELAEDPPTVAQLLRFASKAESIAPAVIAYAVPNSAVRIAAWSAGFTHVGGEIFLRSLERPFKAVRMEPKDLYVHQHQN